MLKALGHFSSFQNSQILFVNTCIAWLIISIHAVFVIVYVVDLIASDRVIHKSRNSWKSSRFIRDSLLASYRYKLSASRFLALREIRRRSINVAPDRKWTRVSRDEVNSASASTKKLPKNEVVEGENAKTLINVRYLPWSTVASRVPPGNIFLVVCKTCKTRRFSSTSFLRLRHNLLQRDYPRERNAEKCILNAMKEGGKGRKEHFDLQETSRLRITEESKRSFTITFDCCGTANCSYESYLS